MKKIWIITLLAVATALSCAKINEQETVEPEEKPAAEKTEGRIVFNIQVNQAEGQTKAVKSGWETGDVVYVFFSGAAAPKHLKMTFDGTSWTSAEYNGATLTPDALGLQNGDTGTMRAVFLPFGSDAVVSASGTSFIFDKTYYTYYLTASLPYTVKDNEVSGALNMLIPDEYVQFFVEDASAVDEAYTLGTDAVIPVGVASIAADGTITETSDKVAGNDMTGYAYQGGYLFSGKLNGSYAYSGSYYFAKTKTADNSRADYFVSGKALSSHSAVKLPANDNVYAVVSGTPNEGKWVPVGSDITVQLYKSGTSLGEWYSCNYGQSVPESTGVNYTPGSAHALGVTLPTEDQLKGINDNCSFTLLTVHGRLGTVVNADSGFLFLPLGTHIGVYLSSPGIGDTWGLTILTNGDHYMYTYISFSECQVRPVNNCVDLSASATANCYIVSSAGKYKFKATVKGNGGVDPLTGATATTIDPASIAGVKVLWELGDTYGKAIKYEGGAYDISYSDGYVFFSTPDTFQSGDAYVAIYDSSDNILWSWLIWATPEPGTTISGGNTFMDRNLGAIAGGNYMRGFLYEWGRKDPFPAADGNNYTPYTYVPARMTCHVIQTAGEGYSVAYTVAHPTTYLDDNPWVSETDYRTTLWSDIEKTVYDPSPAGWRVPTKDQMVASNTGLDGLATGFIGNCGADFGYGNPWIGYYWSSTAIDRTNAYAFYNNSSANKSWPTQEGYAIRCVRE